MIELGDIQGDILQAYGNRFRWTTYLFVAVRDAAAGRAWLGGLSGAVTSAERWDGDGPEATLNVALSAAGLRALALPEAVLETFSSEFKAGMRARAEALGDTGSSSPARWDDGLREATGALLTINARSAEALAAAVDVQLAALGDGLALVHREDARLLGDPERPVREHFGFADGFSQPAVEGMAAPERTNGGGVPLPEGGWRPLAPGEFVLGHPDEETRNDPEGRLPRAPADPYGRNGSYMVWRKLHQDVALFRRTMREAAVHWPGGDADALAAKVVGRRQDGTPLVASGGTLNDFRYAGADAHGHGCPLGSHIRRANPRDALDPAALLSFRHRMIRRGMPYGDPLPDGELEDDGADRGLLFVCFVASLSRQFEAVQIQWLNDGNVFHLGHDRDFLLGGDAPGKMTVQGEPPYFVDPARPFVRTRGGEYLFVPGLRALAALAQA